MRIPAIRKLILCMAATAALCAASPAAGVPPPPPCMPTAELCERLPWIEQILWNRDKTAITNLRAMASGDAHERVRERSLGALAILGDAGAPNVFFDRLASDRAPAVRRAAAEGIGIMRLEGGLLLLTGCLQKDHGPMVRAECARAIGRTGGVAAVPFLSAALIQDASPQVRALSAWALSRMQTVQSTGFLALGVRDEDLLVRLYALRGLVDIAPSFDVPLLKNVWETTNDSEMRLEAFRGLIITGEAARWLGVGLANPDERIRFLALKEWLTRLSKRKEAPMGRNHETVRRIEPFLSDPARGIREMAKTFLERQGLRVRPSGFIYILQD